MLEHDWWLKRDARKEAIRLQLIEYVESQVLAEAPEFASEVPFSMPDIAIAIWEILNCIDPVLHKPPCWDWPKSPDVAEYIVRYWQAVKRYSIRPATPWDYMLQSGDMTLDPQDQYPQSQDPHRIWNFMRRRLIYEFHGDQWNPPVSRTGFMFIRCWP